MFNILNKERSEVHECSNIPQKHIDIIEQMIENTRPKVKPRKKGK